MRLDGRAALITGGTQGVGAAIAESLAQAGCDLILHGLHQDDQSRRTVELCSSHGVSVQCVFQDLSLPTEQCVPELVASIDNVQQQWSAGQIDILVNNAGTYCDLPFLEMNSELLEKTMRLNVHSGYFLTQCFAKRWIADDVPGRVLFTGSINGLLSEADHTAYDASKGAVHALVRSLCVALAPHRIRVNGLAPGLIMTPLTAPVLQQDSESLAWMQLHTPNGQVPQPHVCGPAAVFLLSDEAEHIHGQMLMIDGGMSVWQQPDLPQVLRGKFG